MGHSFGGVSVMGAVEDCAYAKAVIAIDPWFLPRKGQKIGAGDKKSICIFSDTFRKDCLERDKDLDLVVET
jgi:hypothetical protein